MKEFKIIHGDSDEICDELKRLSVEGWEVQGGLTKLPYEYDPPDCPIYAVLLSRDY